MTMVEHARAELERLGEDPDVIDWYCRVIAEFASYGHSGGSAMATIPVVTALLRQEALTPLTADPAEWLDHSEISGYPLWQNSRDSRAFSDDGGETYWWLHEKEAAGSIETTPIHKSEAAGEVS